MRIYISGPMTGYPEYNFPAFHAAANAWREAGWEVVNPAEAFGGETDRAYIVYASKDLADLKDCDAIALLPGWQDKGARGSVWEYLIACDKGLLVYDARNVVPPPDPLEKPESILAEADRLVSGDRQQDYGHPIEDFTRTGRMWGAIIGVPDVPPEKVAMCMVALKLSRECNRPKRDNRTDAAGYVKTLELVRERQGLA